MDKFIIEKLLTQVLASGHQFTICTDIAEGKGINGVGYKSFALKREGTRVSGAKYTERILGVEVLDCNIHIVVKTTIGEYNSRTSTSHHYIPLSHIVEFIITNED